MAISLGIYPIFRQTHMKSSDCASFNSCMEATLAAIFRGIPMAQVHKMFVKGTQGDSAGIPDMLASVARVMAGYQNNSTYLEEENGMVVNLIKLKSGASTAKGTQNLMSRLLTHFQPKTFCIGPLVTERMMHGYSGPEFIMRPKYEDWNEAVATCEVMFTIFQRTSSISEKGLKRRSSWITGHSRILNWRYLPHINLFVRP